MRELPDPRVKCACLAKLREPLRHAELHYLREVLRIFFSQSVLPSSEIKCQPSHGGE
jgi:hypothetical protein